MKKSLTLILLSLSFALMGQDSLPPTTPQVNELAQLDALIESTRQNLAAQEKIRQLVSEYLTLQAGYRNDIDNREKLVELVRAAHTLLENIKANHLIHVFSPDFLSELSLFSQVAVKRGIPKP